MQLRPLNDRVIVKAVAKEEKTASGIVLPETIDKERPEQGEVIAVGPGRMQDSGQRAAMSVKIGDKVLFEKYGADAIKIDGQELLTIEEAKIIAVIE